MKLIVGSTYTRQDVHSIFSPETEFTPQAGTWGLHGIVSIPNRDNDFVFFVTLGQEQGDHVFDEGITKEGVLSWQSQPRQGLDDVRIQKFINHDDSVHNIYLFFRTDKRRQYTFYGRLGYLTHDTSREKPVYFQWQLLDWDELDTSQIVSLPESEESTEQEQKPLNTITITKAPIGKSRSKGTDKETFRARKVADYSLRDERNRKLGLSGEQLVVEYEKQKLACLGLDHLADAVFHTSVIEGDGAGYDIRSFKEDGSALYIEVKTTRGNAQTDFFMSINEVRFAEQHSESYCLYRLYNFDSDTNTADFFIHSGSPSDGGFNLQPTNFRVSL
jgi:hypothetical protein